MIEANIKMAYLYFCDFVVVSPKYWRQTLKYQNIALSNKKTLILILYIKLDESD